MEPKQIVSLLFCLFQGVEFSIMNRVGVCLNIKLNGVRVGFNEKVSVEYNIV